MDRQAGHISATITAQKAGIRWILAILVVTLVTITAAFSGALVEKTAVIEKLEERLSLMSADVSALRHDVDEKIEKSHTSIDERIKSTLEQLLSETQEDFHVDHQIVYR